MQLPSEHSFKAKLHLFHINLVILYSSKIENLVVFEKQVSSLRVEWQHHLLEHVEECFSQKLLQFCSYSICSDVQILIFKAKCFFLEGVRWNYKDFSISSDSLNQHKR